MRDWWKSIAVWCALIAAVWLLFISGLGLNRALEQTREMLADARGTALGLGLLWLMLTIVLLVPFSSGSVVVLLAVPIFGPLPVFLVGATSGASAAAISYSIGRVVRKQGTNWIPGPGDRFRRAMDWVQGERARWLVIAFVVKAVPNPLFEASGYAFGALRVPFVPFMLVTVCGGLVPLSILCAVAPR